MPPGNPKPKHNEKGNTLGAGRKPDTQEEKKIKQIMKRIKEDRDAEMSRDVLAKNELMYNFIKYGASPMEEAQRDGASLKTLGFARVVLGLYKKAFNGDLKAIEMIFKMTGLHVDRVDHISSDGSMSPKPSIEISQEQQIRIAEAILKTGE